MKSILTSPLSALCVVSFLTGSVYSAETIPAQPINVIINRATKTGVPDPDPVVIGQFGYNMLFTAKINDKTRKLFYKPVRALSRLGIPEPIQPADIGTTKYKCKTGPTVKGAIDEYVYEEDLTTDGLGVAFFHERGKGIYRATQYRGKPSLVFLKKTDTDPTGLDPEKMASGLSIIDWEGKYFAGSSKSNLFPYLAFAAPDKKHGKELWLSDGTPGGTKFFADLNASTTDVENPKNHKITKVPRGSSISPISSYFPDNAEAGVAAGFFSAISGLDEGGANLYNVYRLDPIQTTVKKQPRVTLKKIFTEFELIVQPTKLSASPLGLTFNLPTTLSNGVQEIWGYDPDDEATGVYPLSAGGTLAPTNNAFRSGFRFGYSQGEFFSGVDGANGREPMHAGIQFGSPGIPGEPFVISLGNINPAGDSNPRAFVEAANTVFFVANNGTGEHLYRSNGTANDHEDLGAFNNIRDITPVVEMDQTGTDNGNYVYFVADDAGVPTLWRTATFESNVDATPTRVTTAGTNFVRNPTHLRKLVGNGIYYLFFVCDGAGTEFSTVQPKKGPPIPAQHQVWYTGRANL